MAQQIFVLGNSRSGTTMLARSLALTPNAADLRELHFIEQLVSEEEFASGRGMETDQARRLAARLVSVIRDGYFFASDGSAYRSEVDEWITESPSAAEVYRIVCFREAERQGKTVPIDQTPRNVFFIGALLAAYPEARIVCLVRDPRDVCLSQKGKWRRRFLGADIPLREAIRSWANYHPLITTRIWTGAVRAGSAFEQDPRVMVYRFEDLVNNPEGSFRKICEHTGLEFVSEMLEVERRGSSERKDDGAQKGVDASRVGTWEKQLSGAEIAICEAQAGPLLQQYGYEVSGLKPDLFGRFFWAVILPVKLGLALLLNFKRVRGLWSWARKRIFR